MIERPAFHDPRERGPNAGGLLTSQTMQTKKAMMVLHLVFREPAEILYATTTLFVPHQPQTPQFRLCATLQRVQNVAIFHVHAAPLRLAGSSSMWSQRWDSSRSRGQKQSLVVSDGHLIRPDIYRASLVRRSSNDEAQASVQ